MVRTVAPFNVSTNNSLSLLLRNDLGCSRTQIRRRIGTPRVNVVSPEFCDEILKYIGPSLERHKGCNVVDINPGCGLWSAKVHQFLKPRKHILLEPQSSNDRFKTFLQPLISQSAGVRYATYGTQEGWRWVDDLWDLIQKQHLLPSKQIVNSRISVHDEVKEPLLILANISQNVEHTKKVNTKDQAGHRFLHQLSRQFRHKCGFHSYGPLRILLWTDEVEKYHLMPRSINFRSASLLQLEELYDYCEVASSDSNFIRNRRPPSKDLRSALYAARKMVKTGLQLPRHRRSKLHHAAYEMAVSLAKSANMLNLKCVPDLGIHWLPELETLEGSFLFGLSKHYEDGFGAERYYPNEHDSARMEELQKEADSFVQGHYRIWSSKAVDALLALELRINEIERQIASSRVEGNSANMEEETWNILTKRHREATNQYSHAFITKAQALADNIEAFRHDPPILAWDRRPFEPLQAKAVDFWPEIPLTLYDFQTAADASCGLALGDQFVNALMSRDNRGVKAALDAIGPSTADTILGDENSESDACSLLYDPLKGGRMNIENLRVRMLSVDMIKGLLDAFHKSPFTEGLPSRRG